MQVSRDARLDIIKSIAIIGVLLIHASAVGFSGYQLGSIDWFISVAWGTILRAAVPLFFMVSGALLLNPEKKIDTRQIYTKYLLRIVAALFIWAIAYEGYDLILKFIKSGISGEDIKNAIKNILFFKHHFHLYYLHIIVIVYAFLPITRIFIAHASKRQMEYALLLWLILAIVYPFVRQMQVYPFNMLSGIPAQYAINMTYGAIGYGILGYYLKKYPVNRKLAWLYAVGAVITFFGTVYMSLHKGTANGAFFEGMSPGVLFMAVGIYAFVIRVEKNGMASRICVKLSKASFCIYLVHDFFNMIFRAFGLDALTFSPIISIPVIIFANLALSCIVYLLLSKVPIVKKYLI